MCYGLYAVLVCSEGMKAEPSLSLEVAVWITVRDFMSEKGEDVLGIIILTGDFVVQMPAHQKQDLGHQQTLPGSLNSFTVTAHFFAAMKNLNYTAFIGVQSPKVTKSLCISTSSQAGNFCAYTVSVGLTLVTVANKHLKHSGFVSQMAFGDTRFPFLSQHKNILV